MANASRKIFMLLAVLWLSGCQYAGETTLDDEVQDVGPPLSDEVIGTGKTTLALVLPFTGTDSLKSKQIRNGAMLAQSALSDGEVSLAIMNADSPNYGSLKNPALVAVYAPNGKLTGKPPSRPVNFAIGEEPLVKGGLSIVASDMDSLVAGLRYASPSGAAVVILAPERLPDDVLKRMSKDIGGTVEVIKYAPGAKGSALAALLADIDDITAVGFVETDQKVVDAVAALKRRKSKPLIVGHTGWGSNLVGNPKMSEAIIARPDSSGSSYVSDRYRQEFGGEPTTMSLYGFDIVAVASGLVRQHGAKAITKKRLLDSKGFKGASGAFRFNKDGTVERLFEITKIQSGKLAVVKRAPAGF
jgi:hypothetical protein